MNMTEPSRTLPETGTANSGLPLVHEISALTIAWAADEPARVGEVALLPANASSSAARVLGRGAATPDSPEPRVTFARVRGSNIEPQGPLLSTRLSRVQLRVRAGEGGAVEVENLGKLRLSHNGVVVDRALVLPGDTLALGSQLLLLVSRRTLSAKSVAALDFPFGAPDAHDIVGESSAAWELRERVAFVGPLPGHALIVGESGTGKELVARAIHASSERASRPLLARNASTIPDGIVDAELFGNAKNYPNPGMPERAGLIGDSDGTTLFLDEFGELPEPAQAHLLRVLDSGEYQRLGETRTRRCNLRVVAATNRGLSALKHDVAARFPFRLEIPGLEARREDVPLLVRHLLRRMAQSEPRISSRFTDASGEPRVSLELIETLVRRRYTTHTRELEALLWRAVEQAQGEALELASEDRAARGASEPPRAPSANPVAASDTDADDGAELSPERVQRCLDEHNGSLENAWRALGLANRYVLRRLVKKHGLEIRRRTVK